MMKILKPGLFTSIQDMGRPSFASWGVPESGCMDRNSARLANALLGNDESAAVLECTMVGPELEFMAASFIAIVGADFELFLNGERIDNNMVHQIHSGDHLVFGKLRKGLRVYLAIAGGFQSEMVLGSRSYYFPITNSDRLKQNQIVPCGERNSVALKKDNGFTYTPLDIDIISVRKGPEYDWLNKEQQNFLNTAEFKVSNRNNRMAYQLEPSVGAVDGNLLTCPVVPGTVQITPVGSLFVLMRDGQTTGGYPRVLQLTEESLNALAQLRTGSSFRLKIIK